MDNKSFSLLEVMLVMAIFLIIAAFVLPMSVSQVSTERVQKELLNVKGYVKTYQEYASSRKLNRAYGLKFTQTKITLFDSTDCTNLTRNIIDVNLENNVKMNVINLTGGATEVCFIQGSFKPNNSGNINFTDGTVSYRMDISSEGVINYYSL